ncbi:unnamed protein product [Ixodes hexagonus]
MEGRLLLNVVVGQGAPVFELLAGEDQTLLVGRDPLFVLNLGLHVLNRVARLNLERDGLPGQGFHKDLHDWSILSSPDNKISLVSPPA